MVSKDLYSGPFANILQSALVDTEKELFELTGKSGITSFIVRESNGKCCDWCTSIVGRYEYPSPTYIFQRHDNCDCTVEYVSEKGIQNVHSKKYRKVSEKDAITFRRNIITIEEAKEINRAKLLKSIAMSEAKNRGLNPLSMDTAVNVLRKDSDSWIALLSEEEKRSILKYTYNGDELESEKLYRRLNAWLRGSEIFDEATVKMLAYHYENILSAVLKNELKRDIITYRYEKYIDDIAGNVKNVISTSVTQGGTFKKPNVAIIIPKGSKGAYIEKLSHNKYKTQREFIVLDKGRFDVLYKDDESIILLLVQ